MTINFDNARQHGMCMAETMRYDIAQIQIYAMYCYNSESERQAFLAGYKSTVQTRKSTNELQN